MTSFVKSAKHIIDIDSDLSYVEIVYDRYISGQGYTTFTDYINTEPRADWSAIMSEKHAIPYDKFLDTMVKDTLEVRHPTTPCKHGECLADGVYKRVL